VLTRGSRKRLELLSESAITNPGRVPSSLRVPSSFLPRIRGRAGESRSMQSEHERRVWLALSEALGGYERIAEITERRLSTMRFWRCGYLRPSLDAIDRLIGAVGALPYEDVSFGLLIELMRWREDSLARKAAGTAKKRQAFLQRFGHLPDDPAWQRRKVREGDAVAVTPVKPGRSGIPRSRDRRDF
jgi:hypothetical protein